MEISVLYVLGYLKVSRWKDLQVYKIALKLFIIGARGIVRIARMAVLCHPFLL